MAWCPDVIWLVGEVVAIAIACGHPPGALALGAISARECGNGMEGRGELKPTEPVLLSEELRSSIDGARRN